MKIVFCTAARKMLKLTEQMSFEKFNQNEFDIQSAMRAVEIIEQHVYQMGANDHERGSFQSIKNRLKDGMLVPDEAVAEAEKIEKGKQDYH